MEASLSSSKQPPPPPLLDLRDEEDDEEDPRPLLAPPSSSKPASALLQQQQPPDGPPPPSLGHDDGGSHGVRDHQLDHQLLQPRNSAEARPAGLTGAGGTRGGGGGSSSSSSHSRPPPPQPVSVMMGPASSMLQRLFGNDPGASSSLNDGGLTTRLLQDEDEDEEDGGMLVLPLSASRCCPWPVLGEWVLWFLLALLLTALLGTSGAAPSLAVVVLGVLPNAFLLAYLMRRFSRSVLWGQGWGTFLEAVLWMCPIVVAENLWDYVLIAVTKLPTAPPPPPGEGGGPGEEAYNPDCGPCVLSAFLVSYTVAGFFEELVKFMAIRRLLHQPHVTHPAALLVYAAWAGSAFEIVENLTLYDVRYGVGTAVVRALTPLHALTAMLIGAALARRRFIDRCPPDPSPTPTASTSWLFCSSWWQPWRRWHLGVLLVPTAIHGSFDFLLSILPTTTSPAAQAAALLLPLAIVALTYLYLRHRINEELLRAHPIELLDVPLAVEAGTIDKRALPSRRRLLLLAVLAPLTTLIFYAIISQLVPPHYHHYTWGRRMRLIDGLLAPLSAG